MKYELGEKVRDKVSGFEGIIMSRTEYLHGVPLYGVQPRVSGEGVMRQAEYFSEPAIETLKLSDKSKPSKVRPDANTESRLKKAGPRKPAPLRKSVNVASQTAPKD